MCCVPSCHDAKPLDLLGIKRISVSLLLATKGCFEISPWDPYEVFASRLRLWDAEVIFIGDRRLLTAIVCVSGQGFVFQDERVLFVVAGLNRELDAVVLGQVPGLASVDSPLTSKPCSAESLGVQCATKVSD